MKIRMEKELAIEMPKEISISELAQRLDTSITTVSRALSGKGRVSEKTRNRILNYIEENNYIPNIHRQKNIEERTRTICVTLPGEEDFAEMPYFQKILLSIYDYLQARDYQVIIIKIKADEIAPLKKIIARNKVDGVILTRTIEDGMAIKYLQKERVPFVVIGSYDDENVYQVDVEQENACKELTSILIRMGMRKIALFCADMKHVVTQNRYHGFVKAFQENNLSVDTSLIFDEVGYQVVADKVIEDMLKEQVECIVCMDDNICLNVLNKLRRENVSIPEDMKVASFYNSRLLSNYYPPITCLDFDIKELGMTAAKMLLDLLDGKRTSKRIQLGYQVMLKNSTKMPF